MRVCRTVFIALLVLVSAVVFNAQKLLLDPSYLGQFPTIDRVRAETKGSDTVDSYARYMAALEVINDFMIRDLVTAPNGGVYNMPPAAEKIHYRYSNELTRLEIDSPEPPSKDPRYGQLRDKYEKDPAFADMLIQKFFTPQFRSDYYAWTRKPMPAAIPVKSSAPGTPSNDPSIARAKAAKVDLSLFGGTLKFGDRLQLPRCVYEETLLVIQVHSNENQDCLDDQPANAAATELILAMLPVGTLPEPDPNLKLVYLGPEHRPGWMTGDSVWVKLDQGSIARVVIQTQGRVVEKRAGDDLKAKYGSVYISHSGKITPDVGNAFLVNDLDWSLPGLHVEYKVIEVDQNGRVEVNGSGYVRIETETAYQARIAEEKKQKKSVL
jgi:hypothetical protein